MSFNWDSVLKSLDDGVKKSYENGLESYYRNASYKSKEIYNSYTKYFKATPHNAAKKFSQIKWFLGDYSGYLVCDGCDGYNKLQKVTRCGCWAHYPRSIIIRGKPHNLRSNAVS